MNKRTLIITVIVALIVLSAAGAWLLSRASSNQVSAPSTSESTTDTPTSNPSSGETTITYTDDGFEPATVTIKKGDTLRVSNQSSGELEFSSDNHPAHTDNAELNMAVLRPGASETLSVTRAGTWGFHNHLKSGDTGTLIVTE